MSNDARKRLSDMISAAKGALRAGVALVGGSTAASLIAGALYVGADWLFEPLLYDYPPFRIWSLSLFVQLVGSTALGGIIVSLPIAATLGLMWHRVVFNAGLRSVLAYWLPGLLAGAIIAGVLIAIRMPVINTYLMVVCWGACLGGLTGLFAWLIRRPDLDVANPATPAP